MLVFDTYKFYQQLEKVGFTKEQAEKVTDLVRETQEVSFGEISNNLATKTDLELKIGEVKVDLIKWIVTLLLAQTGILAALVKLL